MKNTTKKTINNQNILEIRQDFPIFTSNPNLVYFDNAATSQIPSIVVEKMNDYYCNYKANVGRTSGKIASKSDNCVENIRSQVAKFLNAQTCEIIWTSGSTESLNLAVLSLFKHFKKLEISTNEKTQNLAKNQDKNFTFDSKNKNSNLEKLENSRNLDLENSKYEIEKSLKINTKINTNFQFKTQSQVIISQIEHHSNFLAWQEYFETRIWQIEKNTLFIDDLALLITENTKILTITHASNLTGQILPIKEIIKKVRSISPQICVIVDGSQAVLNTDVDVVDLDCDFYCFSGHKILAPTGIGVLWASKKWLKILEPPKFGGGMVDRVDFIIDQNISEKNSKTGLKTASENTKTKLQTNFQTNFQKSLEKNLANTLCPKDTSLERETLLSSQNSEINQSLSSNSQSTWQPFPYSWEAGTPNIAGIIGLKAAIEYFQNLDQNWELKNWKNELLIYLKQKIAKIPDICVINPVKIDFNSQLSNQNSNPKFQNSKILNKILSEKIEQKISNNQNQKDQKTQINPEKNLIEIGQNHTENQPTEQTAILTFYHKKLNSFDLAQFLASFEICMRAGSLCCQPFLASLPTNSVLRVSLNFYNTKTEIDFFVEKLVQVIDILS